MKKGTKILLAGTSIVVMGLIAYGLLKKTDVEVQEVPTQEENRGNEKSKVINLSTQEFIERRKKRIAEMRESPKVAKELSTSLDFNSNDTIAKETDTSNIPVESDAAVDNQTTEVSCVVEDTSKLE